MDASAVVVEDPSQSGDLMDKIGQINDWLTTITESMSTCAG